MKKLLYICLSLLVVLFIITGINYAHGDSKVADSVPPQTGSPIVSNIGEDLAPTSSTLNQTEVPPPITANSELPSEDYEKSVGNGKKIPKPNYSIDISVNDQKLRIYDENRLIKEWIVSTGKNNSTPLGRFTIQNRGEWFFSDKYQQGAKWWVSFKDWGVYLFHSIPMDKNRNIIADEKKKLGIPASHGCVRLNIDDAKWIYDNITAGTPVYIH